MRVACYLRVSTDEQKVDLQRDAIDRYLNFKGWHDAAFFIDQGESGSKTSRPAFDLMMSHARTKQFDVILTWKFDRIGRSSVHLITVLNEFKALGIDFISVVESIDTTTPMGKMIFTFLAGLAEFERDTLIMRTNAGIKAAQDRGVHCGRKKVISDEARKDIIYLRSQGMSLEEICAAHPSISQSSVYRIFKGGQ